MTTDLPDPSELTNLGSARHSTGRFDIRPSSLESFGIIVLTVFVKTKQRERREVDRARRAYEQCVAERHTAEEN